MQRQGALNRVCWSICVCASAVPFVLFLFIFWLFVIGDPALDSVVSSGEKPGDLLVAHGAENLRVGVLRYGSFVFVHVLLCLAACLYYFWSLHAHREVPRDEVRFQISLVALFATVVCLTIVVLTTTESAFARLVVVPFRQFSLHQGLDGAFAPLAPDAEGFLYLAILLPTLFGALSVVLASAAFHQVVFLRRDAAAQGGEKQPINAMPVLRIQVTVLSVILVSSVVTARAYYHLFPTLIDPERQAAHRLFGELAGTLSMASGLLYTATLIMAFAPGAALLVARFLAPDNCEEADSLHALLESFTSGSWYKQMQSILQTVLTLVAPALASPLLEAFSV